MRLDIYLFEKGFTKSRTESKELITEGAVTVDGRVITKPSYDTPEGVEINITRRDQFVSRGGLKLEGALSHFCVSAEGRDCLDIGASSGGFTDCLLGRGAKRVVAVDSGQGQLDPRLLSDGRVISIEKYNARAMKREDLPFAPSLAVMDVSFISAKLIIPAVYDCLCPLGEYILLIKPQFEVGRGGVGKGGIVKDQRLRDEAVRGVVDFAVGVGFEALGMIESPIKGGDGNTEYLAYFRKGQ